VLLSCRSLSLCLSLPPFLSVFVYLHVCLSLSSSIFSLYSLILVDVLVRPTLCGKSKRPGVSAHILCKVTPQAPALLSQHPQTHCGEGCRLTLVGQTVSPGPMLMFKWTLASLKHGSTLLLVTQGKHIRKPRGKILWGVEGTMLETKSGQQASNSLS
jgi:hypothetical protein